MFKIESNIEIPKGKGKASEFVELFKKMKVGDSVFLKDYTEVNSLRQSLTQFKLRNKNNDFKKYSYVSRKDGPGYRFWKILKENKNGS